MTPPAGRAAAAITISAGVCLEHWGRTTRATRAEKRASLPGDEAVSDPRWQLTRAITIAAPPAEVWPWLVQMGYPKFRAGWYAPYWLDRIVWRIKDRSAERIIPELQTLAVGDRIPDSPDWSAFFTVQRLEPKRTLVLYSTTHPLPMYTDVQFGWSFVLNDRHGSTRLILRARMNCTPVWPAPLVWVFFRVVMNLGDMLEAGSMLRGVRRRATAHSTADFPPWLPG
jgi:hypothetical protein